VEYRIIYFVLLSFPAEKENKMSPWSFTAMDLKERSEGGKQ
jgi:hypothetical protein